MKDAAVNRLAKSITQLTLCQVTTGEVDAATKLLDKACQKLQQCGWTSHPITGDVLCGSLGLISSMVLHSVEKAITVRRY